MILRISLSSIFSNSDLESFPASTESLASRIAVGRLREPICSARKGGGNGL
jgi:hypothetical protein